MRAYCTNIAKNSRKQPSFSLYVHHCPHQAQQSFDLNDILLSFMADKETTIIMNANGMYRISFVFSRMPLVSSRPEQKTVYERT